VFSTAADNQPSVEVHVVQGEREMAADNKSLGRFILDGILAAPRGVPQIEVTFDIDTNGILNVKAKDKGTGKEQNIRITASTGLSKEEIEKMKAEAKANEAADKEARAKVDKLNEADNLIFQTEKQLKEFGDKLPADKKSTIENAVSKLKEAHKSQDIPAIEVALTELNNAWQAASQDMYNASQQGGPQQEGGADQNANSNSTEDVQDAEVVEEVK
jgi:molecular chaperone DnaK